MIKRCPFYSSFSPFLAFNLLNNIVPRVAQVSAVQVANSSFEELSPLLLYEKKVRSLCPFVMIYTLFSEPKDTAAKTREFSATVRLLVWDGGVGERGEVRGLFMGLF